MKPWTEDEVLMFSLNYRDGLERPSNPKPEYITIDESMATLKGIRYDDLRSILIAAKLWRNKSLEELEQKFQHPSESDDEDCLKINLRWELRMVNLLNILAEDLTNAIRED